jgi:hypothetical protein
VVQKLLPAADVILAERIALKIHLVRGHKVMLDADLAVLYQVPTKRLNEAVTRKRGRFPVDFSFRLAEKEATSLGSQIATLNAGRGDRRYSPYVFTEQGVAMLSSVLKSERGADEHRHHGGFRQTSRGHGHAQESRPEDRLT